MKKTVATKIIAFSLAAVMASATRDVLLGSPVTRMIQMKWRRERLLIPP